MKWRWNITSTGRKTSEIDGYYLSYPKSGRTWFRVFLYKYYACLDNVEFEFGGQNYKNHQRIIFTHDVWENQLIWSAYDRLRGKGLIPTSEVQSKPIVLMARDPRDVVVSLYFQLQKRMKISKTQELSMPDFIRHEDYGMPFLVKTMNYWYNQWGEQENFLLIRYEDCKLNAKEHFSKILKFYKIPYHENYVDEALEFSKFENMKKMESSSSVKAFELSTPDGSDPEAFKVRRGKIGGFADYFEGEDLNYLKKMTDSLLPIFNYS